MGLNKENFINLIDGKLFSYDLFDNTIRSFLIENNIQYIRTYKNEYFIFLDKFSYLRCVFNYRIFKYNNCYYDDKLNLLDVVESWLEPSSKNKYYPLYQYLKIFENE